MISGQESGARVITMDITCLFWQVEMLILKGTIDQFVKIPIAVIKLYYKVLFTVLKVLAAIIQLYISIWLALIDMYAGFDWCIFSMIVAIGLGIIGGLEMTGIITLSSEVAFFVWATGMGIMIGDFIKALIERLNGPIDCVIGDGKGTW